MNIRIIQRALSLWPCVLGALSFSAWGGGGDNSVTVRAGAGMLNVQLTDSSACGYNKVNVTVDHVQISPDGTRWTTIPVDSSVGHIDLLSLSNGIVIARPGSFARWNVPAGTTDFEKE